jgi:NAD(P)-dependent dehydrogenase (short-subunit alcohol dehydrogenase family)
MTHVIVVIGAGSIGQAIARRVSSGKHVLLADLRKENADAAAKALGDAGFAVSTAIVDVSSRESVHALVQTAVAIGEITGVIHAAGVSPTQASPATILKVDLYGTALVLEGFGRVIARGGAGVVIITPLAKDELSGPRGPGYRRMIEASAVGRAGTPDEVGNVGALLMGPEGAFITGSDFLMDGGVTAAYWYGEIAPK